MTHMATRSPGHDRGGHRRSGRCAGREQGGAACTACALCPAAQPQCPPGGAPPAHLAAFLPLLHSQSPPLGRSHQPPPWIPACQSGILLLLHMAGPVSCCHESLHAIQACYCRPTWPIPSAAAMNPCMAFRHVIVAMTVATKQQRVP